MNTTESPRDVYSIVTNRIISQLEYGTVPWRKPWTDAGIPQNFISKRPYRGINVWLLASLGYKYNHYLTWKQVNELGGSVKEDEKAHLVIFTRWIEKKVNEEMVKMPFLSYYKVFNIDQCEGIAVDKLPTVDFKKNNNPIEACEAIYRNMPVPPEIHEEHDFAYYQGHGDLINMPLISMFNSRESYYATLFHELIHSTGIPDRLNRRAWIKETSFAASSEDKFSLEELVAEMGTCYLESVAGIVDSQFQQNDGYIDGWLAKLRNDKRFVVIAGALAQKATDYILNIEKEDKARNASHS
jgi:antirestriction protein ArdC